MPSLDPAFPTHAGCSVLPLIGGPAYFTAIKAKIDALTGAAGDFIYLTGWWLDPNFSLGGGTRLTDLLIAKARAGVDVRVMGWVLAPSVLQNSQAQSAPQLRSILGLNGQTMSFINALRGEPLLSAKAVLNILAHPAGAVHTKMAVVGNAATVTAFTGGLDFQQARHQPMWHDVQTQVAGPAVQGVFDTFRLMWTEVRGRPPVSLSAGGVSAVSHTLFMPDLPARTLPGGGSGTARVQSVRTFPQMRFSSVGSVASLGGASIPTNTPLSFATSGLFEIKAAWQSGITGAQTYIYIEDQGFSSREVFDWINAAVKASPTVKVVVLAGRVDPNDDVNSGTDKFFRIAVNNHLLAGLNAAQIERVGVFSHQTKVIHAKTTIVDDSWAIVGSANAMRRSLYTDVEHSLAYMDDGGSVTAYRTELWGVHLQRTAPTPAGGLSGWFSLPYPGPDPAHFDIRRLRLPLPAATLTAEEQVMYDQVMDADSRQEWGGPLIDFYMRQYGVGSFSP